jgi:hypothetical protein
MSIPSNLYAEKVFGEHPIALWSLDERVDYLQLIPAEKRDIVVDTGTWIPDNCSLDNSTVSVKLPLDDQVYSISQTSSGQFSVLGEDVIEDYVNEELESLTIGTYALLDSNSSNLSLEIGFIQNGLEFSQSFSLTNKEEFRYFSNTFALPEQEVLSFVFDDIVVEEGQPTVFLSTAHGFVEGDRVRVDAFFDLSNVLSRLETYEIVPVDSDSFSIRIAGSSEELEFSVSQYGAFLIKPIKPISIFLKFSGSGSTNLVYISGLSVGQWSAEFMERSMGQYPEEISGINIPEKYSGIPFSAYGLDNSPGYYLSRENRLLAKNTSMPMVFGSNDLTSILPERFGGPSIIFPGKGFLNEDGRYKTYTFEMWLRIDPETLIPKRIFGPISSSDGLYVDGPFLSLKIGSAIASHYVGEWYRPMLLNILVFRNGASMTINGEKVLDLNFDTAELELPAKTSLAGRDQDWLGIYSYNDIQNFEIDCVSLYSYRVPTVIAKRRWVYGQGVELPNELTDAFLGESFLVDYTFANYGNNHSYPDIARWKQGISENISFKNKVLQAPEYKLPTAVFNNKTSDNWFRSLKSRSFGAINLRPEPSWDDTDGYLFFDQPQVLQQKTVGFYAAFEPKLGFDSEEVLFRLENQITGSYLTANLDTDKKEVEAISGSSITIADHGLRNDDIVKFEGTLPEEILDTKEYFVSVIDKNTVSIRPSRDATDLTISSVSPGSISVVYNSIKYKMLFGSPQEVLVYQTPAITTGSTIVAGINFSKFGNFFGKKVSSFMNNRRQLRLYVGGNKNFEKTFTGNIYTVGFCTARNINRLQYLFSSNGTPFLRYQFDGGEYQDGFPEQQEIADSGYIYEDYIDDILSHTASYTLKLKNFFGERYLDIATNSYWQDYVPLSYFAKNFVDQDEKTRYGLDFIQYNSDIAIPNSFDPDGTSSIYNTDNSFVKTYISFQPIATGPTRTEESFSNTQKLGRDRVISPGSNWMNTKYEVVSGTIIYPPARINLNDVAIVVHVDISSRGIFKNPVRVRSLSLSSQTVDALTAKPVNARLGVSSFPYSRFGSYFDYKRKNPYIIYKDSTPHLYLTKHSGMEMTGQFGDIDRGIAIVANKERKDFYSLAAVNFAMRFDRNDLISEPTKILEIEDSARTESINLWIEPSVPSDKRFKLFVTDKNNSDISNEVNIYINGNLVTNTIISSKSWNMVTLALVSELNLSNKSGRINFVGPILFNNVSYFALNGLQRSNPNTSVYRGTSPESIYGTLVGTNKLIVGDDIPVVPKNYQYSVINNISVRSATIKPV